MRNALRGNSYVWLALWGAGAGILSTAWSFQYTMALLLVVLAGTLVWRGWQRLRR